MSLEVKIMEHMKEAMKAKDSVALEALRAIKSAIILAKTEKVPFLISKSILALN